MSEYSYMDPPLSVRQHRSEIFHPSSKPYCIFFASSKRLSRASDLPLPTNAVNPAKRTPLLVHLFTKGRSRHNCTPNCVIMFDQFQFQGVQAELRRFPVNNGGDFPPSLSRLLRHHRRIRTRGQDFLHCRHPRDETLALPGPSLLAACLPQRPLDPIRSSPALSRRSSSCTPSRLHSAPSHHL